MPSTQLLPAAPSSLLQMPADVLRLVCEHWQWAGTRARWRRFGHKWVIDSLQVRGADVEIDGWAIAPPPWRPDLVVTCDGQPFRRVQYPIPRPDVAAALPHAPWADQSGFVAFTRLAHAPRPGSVLRFDLVDRRTGRPPLKSYYSYFHRTPTADEVPVPEPNRRQRVLGTESTEYFLRSGADHFERMRAAARDVAGRDFDDLANALDWGCGCARLSRYFRGRGPEAFTGADVDPDNVAWCQAHVPFGRFVTIPLHPPAPFADGTFDLVIGLSVFTHLREPDHFEWLAELRRITRPGAVLLLTVNSDTTLWLEPHHLSAEQHRARAARGFVAIANRQYDAELPEADYYQNVYHTHAYLRKHWSRYFTVCDILPGYIGYQDLVVLRRGR